MVPSLRHREQRDPSDHEPTSLRYSPRDPTPSPPPRTRRSSRMNTRSKALRTAPHVPDAPAKPQSFRPVPKGSRSKAMNGAGRGGGDVQPERRSTRRRKRTPTPESEDDSDVSSADEGYKRRSRQRSHSGSRSLSRSLSVIPTVNMPPITVPAPDDAAVRALGLAQSARPGTEALTLSRDDLVRMREGHLPPRCPIRQIKQKRDWKTLTLSEAAWARLEECGGATKGRSWTTREGFDDDGEPVKPDLPYVMLTKLVIASSPRKMLTLNQIYHAMEERWPYFRGVGQTFRNSIRHSLSMNSAFVNVERPVNEGGMGTGKGGYWRVSEDTTTSHRGRTKKPRIDTENAYSPTKAQGPPSARHTSQHFSANSSPLAGEPWRVSSGSQQYQSPSAYSSNVSTPIQPKQSLPTYQPYSFQTCKTPTRASASPQTNIAIGPANTHSLSSSPHRGTSDVSKPSRPSKIDIPTHRFEPNSFVRQQPSSYMRASASTPLSLQSKLPTPPYDVDCGPLMQLANIALPGSPGPYPAPPPPTSGVYNSPVARDGNREPIPSPRSATESASQSPAKLPSFAHLLNPPLSPDSVPPTPVRNCTYH